MSAPLMSTLPLIRLARVVDSGLTVVYGSRIGKRSANDESAALKEARSRWYAEIARRQQLQKAYFQLKGIS
jgi:hypothetical protein